MRKKIIERYREYLGHDCYGYATKCGCGEVITGFTEEEANNNWSKHRCNIKEHDRKDRKDRKDS